MFTYDSLRMRIFRSIREGSNRLRNIVEDGEYEGLPRLVQYNQKVCLSMGGAQATHVRLMFLDLKEDKLDENGVRCLIKSISRLVMLERKNRVKREVMYKIE